ncbi:hypothetical protein KKA15_06945 [Patescibacteria group bacterium]|nr:hypothetical protein [Patescibacteria group bacterium]
MPDNQQNLQTPQGDSQKFSLWQILTVIAIIGILAVIAIPRYLDREPVELNVNAADGPEDTIMNQAESVLLFGRSPIIERYQAPEFGFDFQQGNDVDGMENYIGMKGANYIQLFGPEDGLIGASMSFQITDDKEQNEDNLDIMAEIGNRFSPGSGEWVEKQGNNILENRILDFIIEKNFDANMYKMMFQEISQFKMMSLRIN